MHPSTLCSQARTAPQRLEANWIPRRSQNHYSIGSHLMLHHLPAEFADGRFPRRIFSSSCSTRNLSDKWPTGGFVIVGTITLYYLNIRVHDLPCEGISKTLMRSCRPTTLYGIPILDISELLCCIALLAPHCLVLYLFSRRMDDYRLQARERGS